MIIYLNAFFTRTSDTPTVERAQKDFRLISKLNTSHAVLGRSQPELGEDRRRYGPGALEKKDLVRPYDGRTQIDLLLR